MNFLAAAELGKDQIDQNISIVNDSVLEPAEDTGPRQAPLQGPGANRPDLLLQEAWRDG